MINLQHTYHSDKHNWQTCACPLVQKLDLAQKRHDLMYCKGLCLQQGKNQQQYPKEFIR